MSRGWEDVPRAFVHLHVSQLGPDSWKVKCGVHVADDVMPMTDAGTLIMRNGPLSTRRREAEARYSIAPFAVDIEDHEEPARNADAFGEMRFKTQLDLGRTTTRASFWSGLSAGVATLGIGIGIAITAFSAEAATGAGGHNSRSPHLRDQTKTAIAIDSVELAETKFVAKKKHHRVRRVAAAESTEEAPAPAAEPTENE